MNVTRGYLISFVTPGRSSQYREAVLWAQANRGPQTAGTSHITARAAYAISDAHPRLIYLTIPRSARLRRSRPKGIVIHLEDIRHKGITLHEGLPITSGAKTVVGLLHSGGQMDLIQQAISDARREGFISNSEARQLRRRVA